jgi:hypothetical protein
MSHESIDRIAFDSSSPGWRTDGANVLSNPWVGGVLLILTDHIQG